MRTGLSRQKSARDCATRQLRQSEPGSMVGSARCRSQRETVCVTGCGSEGCQLCNALCLRTTARISNRRLDRKGFETTVFSAEEKNHGTAVARSNTCFITRGSPRGSQEYREIPPAFA